VAVIAAAAVCVIAAAERKKTMETKSRIWTRDFILIVLTTFITFMNFHIHLSAFSYYIISIGGTDAIAGTASLLYSIASVVMRPVVGWLLDTKGRRLVLLVGSLAFGLLPFGFIVIGSISLAIILRAVQGLALAYCGTGPNTIACDIIPKERFGEGIGYFSLASAVSSAVAPGIGLGIMNSMGFDAMFIFCGATTLVAFVINLFIKVPVTRRSDRRLFGDGGLKKMFSKDALPASCIFFCYMGGYGCMASFIALYGATVLKLGNAGAFFTCVAVATFLSRLVSGKIADRKGEGQAVYIGILTMAIPFLGLCFFPCKAVFFGGAVIIGIGYGMIQPAMQAMAMRTATEENRGAASVTYLCAYDVSVGIGGMIAGVIATAAGYRTMFGIMCLMPLIGILLYVIWGRKSNTAYKVYMANQKQNIQS